MIEMFEIFDIIGLVVIGYGKWLGKNAINYLRLTSFSTFKVRGPTKNLVFTVVWLLITFTLTSPSRRKVLRPYIVALALGGPLGLAAGWKNGSMQSSKITFSTQFDFKQ